MISHESDTKIKIREVTKIRVVTTIRDVRKIKDIINIRDTAIKSKVWWSQYKKEWDKIRISGQRYIKHDAKNETRLRVHI